MTKIAVIAAALACRAAPPTGGESSDAVVYVASNVGDAHIYIDGRIIGPVRALAAGIALDPGAHRIELRHDDHFSRYAEVTLRTGQKLRLDLEMVEILP